MTDTDRRTAVRTERAYVALAEALASTEWWDHGHVEDERDWTSRELAERILAALEADDAGRAAIVAWLLTPGYADATATGGSYTSNPKTQTPAAQEPKP